jgi:hypothetical protein
MASALFMARIAATLSFAEPALMTFEKPAPCDATLR